MKRIVRALTPEPVRRLWRSRREARRTPKEIFSEIYKKGWWGGDGQDFYSGNGSRGKYADIYVDGISQFISRMPKQNIVDLGCGDFHIGSRICPLAKSYIACDVVPELIERNKKLFFGHPVEFRCLNIVDDELPSGDIVIIKEVLQHLSNVQIAKILKKLNSFKYLILCEHIPNGDFVPNTDRIAGGGFRLMNKPPSGVVVTQKPFDLKVISETITSEVVTGNTVYRTLAYQLA